MLKKNQKHNIQIQDEKDRVIQYNYNYQLSAPEKYHLFRPRARGIDRNISCSDDLTKYFAVYPELFEFVHPIHQPH